jgi:exosortase family protein XrtM
MNIRKSGYRNPKPKALGNSGSTRLLTNRLDEWLQFILFVCCYSLLNYGYFKIPVELFINVIYYHGVVNICADLINWIAPKEQVLAQYNHLLSTKADLEIVRGCDGAGVLFLLVSAIVVFPSSWRRKLMGLILGIGLIYIVNLLRVSALYFVIAYHQDWFLLIHTYLAPTLMIIIGCCYFACWAISLTNKAYESA